jgi:putative hydrolase of the HAD superfamily
VIFFDVDNTLLDYTTTGNAAALRFLDHFKHILSYSPDDFLPIWHQLTEKYYEEYVKGQISFIEQRRCRVRSVFAGAGIELEDDEADRTMSVYLDAFEANTTLFSDVLPVLDALKNERLGIISNGEPTHQHHKIEHLGIRDRFDVIVISDEVGVAKPDPAIFIWAAQQAGENPSDCIHTGDLLETDAMGAHVAGFQQGVWINREMRQAVLSPLPDGVSEIYHLSELLPLILR